MPTLVIGSTASYDGDTNNAAGVASTLGSDFASASSGALTLKHGVEFDNSTSSLRIRRTGQPELRAKGGETITSNREGPVTVDANSPSGLFGTEVVINSGVYVYSTRTSDPAIKIAKNGVSVRNSGIIMGKGGQGGSANTSAGRTQTNAGLAGGPAIEIASGTTGVTITNNSGAYIAGGGGGGGAGSGSSAGTARVGGGGGAGGGNGGIGSQNRGVGNSGQGDGATTMNAQGSQGSFESASASRNAQGGYGGGGGNGYEWGLRIMGTGAGGGTNVTGAHGTTQGSVGYGAVGNAAWNGTNSGTHHGGIGGAQGNAGGNSRDGGSGGGGGGFGASGGAGGNSGDTSSYSNSYAGGTGGAAIKDNGVTYTLSNSGTVYGVT